MLGEGRIPLKDVQHEAVNKLAEERPGEPMTLTHRDPGESGPLLAYVGEDIYEISEDGKRKKQRGAA